MHTENATGKTKVDEGVIDADDLEIQIVDDTPVEDRNRGEPIKKDVLAEDEEAKAYSAEVARKIKEHKRAVHDERRAKEAAIREREEAIAFAKKAMQEVQETRRRMVDGEVSYSSQVKTSAETRISAAKDKFKIAYEAGDAEALANAQEELHAAQIAKVQADNWHANATVNAEKALHLANNSVESQQMGSQQPYMQQQASPQANQRVFDKRADDWAKKNEWFGTDPVMTSLAYGVHEKLLKQGIHPEDDADEYYEKINAEMRTRFPDYQWDDAPPKTPKKPPVIASVTRNSSGGKSRVVLTHTQIKLAEKLGITPEAYARELVKLDKGE